MKIFNFKDVSKDFKAFLLDANGVFWGDKGVNGVGLYPGSKELMENLMSKGKKVGILSNSTQLFSKQINKFKSLGIEQDKHFNFYLTSGDITRDIFLNKRLPFITKTNKYFLSGAPHPRYSSHLPIFDGTIYSETKDIDEADFIYVSIPNINGQDECNPEVFRSQLQKLIIKNKPMICPNPDKFVITGNPPKQVVRQGSIAKLYEEMNGEVFYIGKPKKIVYDYAMKKFNELEIYNSSEILMVGDNPETDISGANNFGISSALLTETGIMGDRIKLNGLDNSIKNLSKIESPTFLINRFI